MYIFRDNRNLPFPLLTVLESVGASIIVGFSTEGVFFMNTSLVAQNTDFVEQAKQLSAGCDFFKELDELYAPHAEAAAEAFRREWMERYENGEIELEEDYELDSEGNFGDELKAGDSEGWNMTDPSSIAKYQRLCQDKAFSRVFSTLCDDTNYRYTSRVYCDLPCAKAGYGRSSDRDGELL